MKGQVFPVLFFCLATGAAMGCLFLLFRGVSLLLGLRRLGTALLDLLCCCLCGAWVFLCALAVDNGRLRLYQAALQGLGAWSAVAALGPFLRRGLALLKKILRGLWGLLDKGGRILRGHFPDEKGPGEVPEKKRGKKQKKQRKKT